MKRCTKCGFPKDLNAFAHNKRSKDGRTTWCLGCIKDYGRAYRAEEKAKREARRIARIVKPPTCWEPGCDVPAKLFCKLHDGKSSPRLCAGGCGTRLTDGAFCWVCGNKAQARLQAHRHEARKGEEAA